MLRALSSEDVKPQVPIVRWVVGGLALLSGALAAYHGVKRNNGSVGWGLVWGAAGTFAPIITPAIAIGQGFAKPKRT